MTGPKAFHAAPKTPTLTNRSLPPRVRRLLAGLLDLVGGRLEQRVASAFDDAEGLLFARGGADAAHGVDRATAIARFRRAKTHAFTRFLVALESALAEVRGGVKQAADEAPASDWLALVDHDTHAEEGVITEIASRANVRHGLALSLLGQRFGVIAATAPYDADRLPIGPRRLCSLLGEAMTDLDLPPAHRQMVLRQFDRTVIQQFGDLVDAANDYLVREDVLPTLQFVPMRTRSSHRARTGGSARPEAARQAQTAWPGEAPGEGDQALPAGQDLFAALHYLLSARAGALPGPSTTPPLLDRSALDAILAKLQRRDAEAVANARVRDHGQLKRAILAEIPGASADTDALPLPIAAEDAGVLELTCLLFTQVMRHVRGNSPSASLLGQIQIPFIRHTLADRGPVSRRDHPARRLLNAMAEVGANWRAEQDADPALLARLHSCAERLAREYAGRGELFVELNDEIEALLKAQIERARISERRHVEAARGREKLALARRQAVETVEAALQGRRIPDEVHALLAQVWPDVLALTLLRHGPDAPVFRRQSEVVGRLADAGAGPPLAPQEARALLDEIRQALAQVGYHEEESRMIADTLVMPRPRQDAQMRQDIADIQARLAARSRLGEQLHVADPAGDAPMDELVEAWRQRLLELPFGSWMEFGSIDPAAPPVRNRLAWFSPVTGLALFVNTRGQRVGEHAIRWLAQEMAAARLRVVEVGHDTLVDRAWDELVESLRRLAEGDAPAAGVSP